MLHASSAFFPLVLRNDMAYAAEMKLTEKYIASLAVATWSMEEQ